MYRSVDESTGPKIADVPKPPPPLPIDDSPPMSDSIEDTPLELPSDLWPWIQSFNCDDSPMDWSDQDLNQSILNAKTDATMACVTAFPDLLDHTIAAKDGIRDDHVQRQPGPTIPPQLSPQVFEGGHRHGNGHVGGTCGDPLGGGIDNKDDLDTVIAELAHLSVHLSPLRRSSYSLAGTSESSHHQNQARQKPLIDDATFESVAGWLAHGHGSANNITNMLSSSAADRHNLSFSPLPAPDTKTTSAMLYHTFSASRHLLEILRYLQANVGASSTPALSTTSSSSSSSSDASYFGLPGSSSSSYPRTPGRSPSNDGNNIIRHLVIACHTILLNIYAAVLAVLERDTDPSAHKGNTPALGDIRLVSVVQLCSYLIKRQHRAMDLFLGVQGSLYAAGTAPMSLQSQDFNGPLNLEHGNVPITLDRATSEAMEGLKMEIQERLGRLQQTLCI
ncbi:MAG: hypothetical protein Q9195_003387 [Heterodermia aff. obscurata]